MRDNMGGHYEVTLAMMRATLRLARGEATRRELRAMMFRLGYSEPFVSGYLDMVQRAVRQVTMLDRHNAELRNRTATTTTKKESA